MLESQLTLLISVLCFVTEIFFVFFALRWAKSNATTKDRSLAVLNRERKDLKELHGKISDEAVRVDALYQTITQKLGQTGAQIQAEWLEIQQKCKEINENLDQKSNTVIMEFYSEMTRNKNQMLSSQQRLNKTLETLDERCIAAQELINAMCVDDAQEDMLETVKNQKYKRAKTLLKEGNDASKIAKQLRLSLSEINLISQLQL